MSSLKFVVVVAAAALTLPLFGAPKPTSIAILPAVYGEPFSLTAQVTSPGGVPDGTVTFYVKRLFAGLPPHLCAFISCFKHVYTAEVGTATLVNGVATWTGPDPVTGYREYRASYSGSTDFLPVANEYRERYLGYGATALTLHASSSRSRAGQPVTFTATVRTLMPPSILMSPGHGQVEFTVDGEPASPVTAYQNGQASLTRALAAGTHTITARYPQVCCYHSSSATLVHTVVPMSLSISGGSIVEGNSGWTNVSLVVQLAGVSEWSVPVDYATVDGTARAGADYVAASDTLTFAPGETVKTIDVALIGDTVPEHDQAFSVALSSPEHTLIDGGVASVTIVNDDVSYRTSTYAYASYRHLMVDTPITGSGPFPVIVSIPGTTEYASEGESHALRETARGYVVVTPEYRPAGVAFFPGQLDDLQSAIRWLRANAARLNIDTDRIAVWGSGTGAHLAALLGTRGDRPPADDHPAFSHRVQAVVDWSGPADLPQLQADACAGAGGVTAPQFLLLGCPPETCGGEASPLTHVTADDAPMLLLHGTRDCTVAPAQSRRLHEALRAAGVPATLHLVDAAGPADPWWESDAAFAAAEDFLDTQLKGIPPKRRAVH